MLNTIFSPWPSFTQEESDAISCVLLSNKINYWTGNETREFEKEYAQWVGTKYAIALANGTVALDLALKAIDIKHGDEIIVTPRSFIASVSTVINAGGIPIFADVDPISGNITPQTIAQKITEKTKAIIPVHLAGYPCEMDGIMQLANQYHLWVIEDCAQAHGALYKGKSVGSIGHIGAWSFCQDKIITTGGEGGMVTTNDELLWKKMWAYKDHGKNYDSVYHKEHPAGFRWLHDSFGTNWRMMEIQAAIGRIQLKKIKDWTNKRQHNADLLRNIMLPFAKKDGILSIADENFTKKMGTNSQHAQYKFYVYIRHENLATGWSRNRIIQELSIRKIPVFSGSCSEIYLEHAFDNHPSKPSERLPNAKKLGETSLMFLVHPTLTDDEMNLICHEIQQVLLEASSN